MVTELNQTGHHGLVSGAAVDNLLLKTYSTRFSEIAGII